MYDKICNPTCQRTNNILADYLANAAATDPTALSGRSWFASRIERPNNDGKGL